MSRVGPSNLGRRRGGRPERSRILVVAEGQRTERQYLEGLSRFARATGLTVTAADIIGLGRDPMAVVRRAVDKRDADRRERQRRDQYDAVWCVFDVDTHERLDAAMTLARREGLHVAISNPCFEVWLLWHFEDRSAAVTAAELRRLLRPHGCMDKNIPANFRYSAYEDALRRCACHSSLEDPYFLPANPGTSVATLVRTVIRAGARPN